MSSANDFRLSRLSSQAHVFAGVDFAKPSTPTKLLDALIAPGSLRVMKNAQVMLIRNIDSTLVNGSIGIVIGFALSSAYPNRPSGAVKGGRKGASTLWPVVEFPLSGTEKGRKSSKLGSGTFELTALLLRREHTLIHLFKHFQSNYSETSRCYGEILAALSTQTSQIPTWLGISDHITMSQCA